MTGISFKTKFSHVKNFILPFLLFFCIHNFSFTQLNFSRYDSIHVFADSIELNNAWAGGLNSVIISQVDLNLDGLKDLFLFEKDGYIVRTYINDGSQYHYAPEFTSAFPKMTVFAFLADYNCDGYEDLFRFAPGLGGMAVYKNTSAQASTLQFSLVTPILNADYNGQIFNLYVASSDIPAISDIDNDGDVDILAWTVNGSSVRYFKNLSMETYGHCDSLMFKSTDDCWGKFFEGISNSVTFPVSCKNAAPHPDVERSCLCPANLLALDMDGDMDKDLVLGRLTFKNLLLLTNGGDTGYAEVIAQDTTFPSNSAAVDLLFPAPFFLDVNNDNLKDLLVSTSTQNATENLNSVWLYSNSGTNNAPVFTLAKKNFLQEEMIDLGSGSNPAFFDYNSDGLMDIVAGNYGYYSSQAASYRGQLALFENTGTQTQPEFTLKTRDYMSISSLGLTAVYPAFGDLDSDGDMDMLIGHFYGGLFLYENTAAPGSPANFVLASADYENIDIGSFSAPQVIDLNRDGLSDLVIGEKDGTINYFQNKGTTSTAVFDSLPTIDTLGGIDVEIPCCTGYNSPFFFENADGKYCLITGSQRGVIYYFTSIDENIEGAFTLTDSIVTGELRVSVSMADINMDNKNEIAAGVFPGGMHILKGDFTTTISFKELINGSIKIFPNPNHGTFTVECSFPTEDKVEIAVQNLLGETIYMAGLLSPGPLSVDLSDYPAGLYLLRINSGQQGVMRKIVKL